MNYILIFAMATIVFAEESELSKRGVAKSPTINSLPNNGHQKPEQLSYSNYKQTSPAPQTPLYPLAPSSYPSDQQSQVPHQQMFSFLPAQSQIVPFSFVQQQPLAVPKFQLIAMKGSNGQMHLTLVPQNLYLGPQNYVSPPLLPYTQQVLSNNLNGAHGHAQAQSQVHSAHGHNNYVTPQPFTHATQGAGVPLSPQTAFYQPHQSAFGYSHNPLIGQHSTMLIYTQPAPQLYNNYAASGSNLLYSPVAQQLLNYYHSNPQAKNQLLYGNGGGYQQGNVNSYQTPLNTGEYEKPTTIAAQQNISPQKSENDISLNTNEFVPQQDEQFRPIASYGSRTPPNFKN